jgi:5-methylcytosine-specific restriction endonuclease McrA
MRSPAWKGRRIVALIRANYTCERCGYVQSDSVDFFLADLIDDRDLHVHHKTYARLGHELDTDLEVLCNVCHTKKHAMSAIKPRFMRAG